MHVIRSAQGHTKQWGYISATVVVTCEKDVGMGACNKHPEREPQTKMCSYPVMSQLKVYRQACRDPAQPVLKLHRLSHALYRTFQCR